MKNKLNIISLVAVVLGSYFIFLSANVRNVDFLLIFASGAVSGILLLKVLRDFK
jgi:hypothetical protein